MFAQISFAQTSVFDTQSNAQDAEEYPQTQIFGEIKTEFISTGGDEVARDFVVGPGKTELNILPGESKTIEILVTNRMGDERVFNLETEDAAGTNDPSRPIKLLGDKRGHYTLKDYINYPQSSFVLKHNQRARIPVTIRIPKDAEPGGMYGSVLVTTTTKDAGSGEKGGAKPTSAIVSRIGSLFFITVPGDTEIEGELKSFTTLPSKKFFASGPINFQILFENTGSLHLNPYGEVRVTNLMGEEVGFVELEPWFAMPKSLRSREIEWTRELLIGRYTATAKINRGYNDIIDTQDVTFWVLPWKIIGGVFVGLFFIFFIIRLFFKTFEFKRKMNDVK